MAFETLGIGSVFDSNTKPWVDNMGRARDENGRFVKSTDRIPPSLAKVARAATNATAKIGSMARGIGNGSRKISSGFRDMAMGAAPLAFGMGAAVTQAASFEKQMSAVGAVSRANQKDMVSLSKEARKMGIVSVFSATQAGEGMELLARAGAKPAQIIAGLGGVMNAASADGITLAQSSDVVSKIIKGMGLEWSQTSNVADVLALASASANTNILGLGESFVYGVSTSKSMNVSLEETTAIFSKLADAGLGGSLGGTAYTNMMTKLSKPSRKANDILKDFGIVLEDDTGKLRKIASIVSDFDKKLSKIKSTTKKQALTQEVFGKRGARAFSALATAGEESTLSLEESYRKASAGQGTALEMSKKRLDNFAGSMTLLKSSLEGMSIGFFGPMLKPLATSVRQFTEGFNNVLLALNDINDITNETPDNVFLSTESVENYGNTAVQIAFGLRDAIDSLGRGWELFTAKVKEAGKWFNQTFGVEGNGSLRNIVKIGAMLLMAGAALTPLILMLATVKFVLGGLISVLVGVGTVAVSAFLPLLTVVGGALLLWRSLKKENETFLETSKRVWGNIKIWALDVYQNVLRPFWEGLKSTFIPIVEELGKVWDGIVLNMKLVFSDLFNTLFGWTDGMKVDWVNVGQVVGAVIGSIATAILTFVQYAIPVIASVVTAIWKVAKGVWGIITYIVEGVAEHFAKFGLAFEEMFGGNFLKGLSRLGSGILDLVLKPVRLLLEGVLALTDILNIDVPNSVRTFAKEGVSGLMFDIPAPETEKTFKTRSEMLNSLGIVKTEKLIEEKKKGTPEITGKLGQPIIPLLEGDQSLERIAKEAAQKAAAMKGAVVEKPDVNVNNVIEDKREMNIKTNMCVDGESLSVASGRHKAEVQERTGFKSTPWQRRALLEHGSAPITKG